MIGRERGASPEVLHGVAAWPCGISIRRLTKPDVLAMGDGPPSDDTVMMRTQGGNQPGGTGRSRRVATSGR